MLNDSGGVLSQGAPGNPHWNPSVSSSARPDLEMWKPPSRTVSPFRPIYNQPGTPSSHNSGGRRNAAPFRPTSPLSTAGRPANISRPSSRGPIPPEFDEPVRPKSRAAAESYSIARPSSPATGRAAVGGTGLRNRSFPLGAPDGSALTGRGQDTGLAYHPPMLRRSSALGAGSAYGDQSRRSSGDYSEGPAPGGSGAFALAGSGRGVGGNGGFLSHREAHSQSNRTFPSELTPGYLSFQNFIPSHDGHHLTTPSSKPQSPFAAYEQYYRQSAEMMNFGAVTSSSSSASSLQPSPSPSMPGATGFPGLAPAPLGTPGFGRSEGGYQRNISIPHVHRNRSVSAYGRPSGEEARRSSDVEVDANSGSAADDEEDDGDEASSDDERYEFEFMKRRKSTGEGSVSKNIAFRKGASSSKVTAPPPKFEATTAVMTRASLKMPPPTAPASVTAFVESTTPSTALGRRPSTKSTPVADAPASTSETTDVTVQCVFNVEERGRSKEVLRMLMSDGEDSGPQFSHDTSSSANPSLSSPPSSSPLAAIPFSLPQSPVMTPASPESNPSIPPQFESPYRRPKAFGRDLATTPTPPSQKRPGLQTYVSFQQEFNATLPSPPPSPQRPPVSQTPSAKKEKRNWWR